jgi:hypothetical protein
MGGARTGEFPSESLLRIVMSSSPCSTFTYKAGLSYIVHVEDRWGESSSVDATITESLMPYT